MEKSRAFEADDTSGSHLASGHGDLVSLGDGKEDQRVNDYAEEKGHDGMKQLEHKTSIHSVALGTVPYKADNATSIHAEGQDEPGALPFGEPRVELYLDPTPKTPRQEVSPSRGPSARNEAQGDVSSTSEIQSIMDQFDKAVDDSGEEEYESSGLPTGGSLLGAPVQHPPRGSSLEPSRPASPIPAAEPTGAGELPAYQLNHTAPDYEASPADTTIKVPPMRISSLPPSGKLQKSDINTPSSPNSSVALPKMPPPQPDPEPDLPFDFHRFLEQLRHRTADPVAKFLRSFLIEFGKKQWMVHEQVKIINDFLSFITNKMAQCEVWRGVSDAEFDNAKEGMEKLVMNRLYAQTFSPAIQPPTPVPGNKGKRKDLEKTAGPGRRGQHQEDIERDEILGQKVRIYGWVQEEHLDIPPVGDSGRRFLLLAQQGTATRMIPQVRRF